MTFSLFPGTMSDLVKAMQEWQPASVETFGIATKAERGAVVVTLWFRWWAMWFVRDAAMARCRVALAPRMAAGIELEVKRGDRRDHPAARMERLRCAAIVQRAIDSGGIGAGTVGYLSAIRDDIMTGGGK